MDPNTILWLLFGVIVTSALYIDLFVKNDKKHAHIVSLKEAMTWVSVWAGLAMAFAGAIYFLKGQQHALEFLAGYLIEESLSVDNMFVFVLIFSFFQISAEFQPRILKYGIIGAIAMRFMIIFAGVALINRFHWVMYIFGGILLCTAIKMLVSNNEAMQPDQSFIVRLVRRWLPFTSGIRGQDFFVKENGRWHGTPLFMGLLVVEASDLIFAVDSIPAVMAVSQDPFIVATSNIFAILGLRALFFLISGIMGMFRFLKYGLAFILMFIGVKMLIVHWYKIPIHVSLAVIASILILSIVTSVYWKKPSEFGK